MSNKHLDNTIYLIDLITKEYREKHKMNISEFLEFDKKVGLIDYIGSNPDIFDSLPDDIMMKKVEEVINKKI